MIITMPLSRSMDSIRRGLADVRAEDGNVGKGDVAVADIVLFFSTVKIGRSIDLLVYQILKRR
jgi:hypothetical protein